MTDFRNSYHFVPRKPPMASHLKQLPDNQKDYGLGEDIAEGHAAYAPGTQSGRIRCQVTLECPTVIGGKRTSPTTGYSIVEPFLFKGLPALPASSLKGMLSSVAESVARAPYRVLDDSKLTVAYQTGNRNLGFTFIRHAKGDRNEANKIGSVHDYVAPDSRPLAILAPGKVTRSMVNPVEAMFGFVRDVAKGAAVNKGTVVSAAGKLRVSHALPSGDWAAKPAEDYFLAGDHPGGATYPVQVRLVRLKEQGQPMKEPKTAPQHGNSPPEYKNLRSATPNFYFVEKSTPNTYIAKKDFGTKTPSDYQTQGGKFYLHHPDTQSQPWKTAAPAPADAGAGRKAAVAVMKAGITFDFHIDFDNLSPHELNILCYALRPSPRFRHKIGLGRGLGLGSIRIDIQDMTLVDRTSRYLAQNVWADDPRSTAGSDTTLAEACVKAHDTWLNANDPGARQALLAIGETHRFDDAGRALLELPVLWVPLTEGKFQARATAAAESDSFAWFAKNDKPGAQQPLPPIGANGVPILGTDVAPVAPPGGAGGNGQTRGRPAQDRGPALEPSEKAGRLKSCKKDGRGAWLAVVIPDDSSGEVSVDNALCLRAGLNRARENARVAYRLKLDGRSAKSLRLI